MFSVTFAIATLFPFQEYYETLVNIPGLTWTPGINERLRGKSVEELKAMLMQTTKMPQTVQRAMYVGTAPASVDWATANPGCVNHIRDQGQCGSCWAFSAIGEFCDRRCIHGKDVTRVQYSEQYVVSCDTVDQGCNGGYIGMVWRFLDKTGTTLDTCVPYTSGAAGVTGTCPTKCKDGSAFPAFVKSVSYVDVATSIDSIMTAVAEGPVTTGFTVYYDFELYTSGIYSHKFGPNMGGHAVEIVGYGTENGVNFWKVKNSWGASWGEAGYFRIVKGTDECGIEDSIMAATV
jgi:cathepsin B